MIIFKQKLDLEQLCNDFGNRVLPKLVAVTNQSKFEGKRSRFPSNFDKTSARPYRNRWQARENSCAPIMIGF